mmetsp:Transcript_5651/g.9449  ORF Transcript_5651/g.9449 Transcript_5651/m.9449 type:complete len:1003 (+) Transcript_5651:184-3192(+)
MQRARSMSAAATQEANSFRVPPRYRFQKHLGSGSYGVVAAFHDTERGRDIAIKRVRRVFDNYLVLRRTLREIRLMSHFRHPNLMRLHKVLPLDANTSDLYLSLELMDCDLDTLVHTKRVVLTDQQVRCFTAQILLGLMSLHSGHVIHRDLKPANIFVRLSRGQVKIGDLGLSRGIAVDDETGEATHPNDELLTEYVVTRWYRAPEVLLARSKYGPSVDVWSVGCMLYEMCSRKALFPGKNSYDQLKRIVAVLGGPADTDTSWVPRESMPLLQKCCQPGAGGSSFRCTPGGLAAISGSIASSDGVDLLIQMCMFNPLRRITVDQALTHAYLAGITSEQDRRAARAVDPADTAYDKMFDGVGRAGEQAALVQLGRLLRREVGKFNGGTSSRASDTTPERSSQASERTPKVMSSRSSRGMHIEPTSAAGERPSSAHSGHSNSLSVSRSARGGSSGTVADRGGGDRGGSSSGYECGGSRKAINGKHEGPEASPGEYGSCTDQPRRRSDPEADIRGRRVGNGTSNSSSARGASGASMPRRRSAEPPSSSSMYEVDRHAESSEYKRVAPGEEPPNGPPAFWLCGEESQSGSSKVHQRVPSRQAVECHAASLRRKAGSGASGTTGSTRATPPGSGPGRSEVTRSDSSRRTSAASRNTPPRLVHGPSGGGSGHSGGQWDHHEGSLVNAKGPSDAAVASPRAGPPQLAVPSPPERHHHAEGDHGSSRRQGPGAPVWLGPDDAEKADMGGLHRGLREAASSGARHDAHSLSSLDDVLREMKAMLRSGGEGADPRDDGKGEGRMRHASGASKGSSKQAAQKGVRGGPRGTSGRGADSTGADDRSPSAHRASSQRARHQRSHHDELDFATCEPHTGHTLPRGTPPRGTLPRSSTPPRSNTRSAATDAPTPPWAESRKPLESLQPEDNTSPAPLAPWHESRINERRSGSVRNLSNAEQDWKTLQSNFHAAIGTHGGAKVRGSGGSHRHATRSGSSAKRTSENHAANSMSGLGFMY